MSIGYNIDISVTYDCNFRCKYCFEKQSAKCYAKEYMSEDIAYRTIEYIKYLKEKLNDEIGITFYGGEPLLNVPIIKLIVEKTKDFVRYYDIITNGFLIDECIDDLMYIKNITNNRLTLGVSYDYSLQDKHRKENTYLKIRNNILLLHKHNITFDTITVLTKEDFSHIDEVVFDYLKLRRMCPELSFRFNIDRGNISNTTFDICEAKQSLEKLQKLIKTFFVKNKKNVFYNDSCNFRHELPKKQCMVRNIYCCVTSEGGVYPLFNTPHHSPLIRDMFYMGNISEDFSELDKKHEELFKDLNFNTPKECEDCNIPCRVFPWDTIKTDISEFNTMPEKDHCTILKLLAEYI